MGKTDRIANRPSSIAPSPDGGVEPEAWVDVLGGWIERHTNLAIRLGNWESRLLADRLAGISAENPIYVTGLARSGSTILLELLSRHRELASHQYRDFPPVLTPWLWNWFVDRAGGKSSKPKERAHKDRLNVTPESPEAFEEVIWMAFFPGLHDPHPGAAFDESSEEAEFEAFYRDNMRKIILIRGGSRYLAKGNYNIARLRYLHRLFPHARFVVPIRDPVWHVASLMKQHDLFCREEGRDVRILKHLERSGHFEFGLGRRAVKIGDGRGSADVERLWREGNEVAGWAALWDLVYGHLDALLRESTTLRAATYVVRYEDLCASPEATVAAILEHCRLAAHDLPAQAAALVSAPDYYQPAFSGDETAEIRSRTGETARAFGYLSEV